jgi:hypothetical protein
LGQRALSIPAERIELRHKEKYWGATSEDEIVIRTDQAATMNRNQEDILARWRELKRVTETALAALASGRLGTHSGSVNTTEAILATDVLIELVQSGLATARIERIDEEDGVFEVTKTWITETGMRVLAARG